MNPLSKTRQQTVITPLRQLFIDRLTIKGLAERTIRSYVDVVHHLTRHNCLHRNIVSHKQRKKISHRVP